MLKCDTIQNRNIKIPGTHRLNDIIIYLFIYLERFFWKAYK